MVSVLYKAISIKKLLMFPANKDFQEISFFNKNKKQSMSIWCFF